MEYTVENYRNKFKKAPIGQWSAATGSFSNVMNEIWEFRPDGMGKIQVLGPFLQPRDEPFYFEWKEHSDLTILVKRFYFLDKEEEEKWVKVTYDFEVVTHDMGSQVAMVEVEEGGEHRKGFGHSFMMVLEWPLGYLGPSNA